MTVIIEKETSREFEILSLNQTVSEITHYVDGFGEINEFKEYKHNVQKSIRFEPKLYLSVRRPQYTHGGVTFEETGEHPHALVDEWYMYNGRVHAAYMNTMSQYTIVRPIDR